MFQTASEQVEAEGLAALHSLTACLSRSVLSADAEDLLDPFLSNILQGNGTVAATKGNEHKRDDTPQGDGPSYVQRLGAAALLCRQFE